MSDDPLLSLLMRHETGLRVGGCASSHHDVLATYWTRSGDALFAFCRDGILLDPEGEARFLHFVAIDDAGYFNEQMVKRAKRMRVGGELEPLLITLVGGEVIDLPLDVREDGMPDLLLIARLIDKRVRIFRSEQRRRNPKPL